MLARSLQDELRKAGLAGPEPAGRAGAGRRKARRAPRPRKETSTEANRPPEERAARAGSSDPRGWGTARGARAQEAPPASAIPARSSVQVRSQLARSQLIARDPHLRGDADAKAAARRRNRALLERARRHRLDDPEASRPFYFARGRRIRRLYVTEEQHRALVDGDIVILGIEGEHLLLPLALAEEIRAQRPDLFLHRVEAGVSTEMEEEDPRYAVPDDLAW